MVTNNSSNIPTAATGKVLQGQGVGTANAFSTATYPATATGTGTILRADGTNWSATTATYPTTAGTSGKVLISDGTNIVSSTPTFPNASATSGKMIQSDGTNWVASTPTFPTTAGSSGKILISDGTNIISSTPTYPNSASGTGTILRADGTNWVATTSTYPNTNAVSTLLYASSANVMGALATANSGVLTTDASGVPSIDTTNFTRQTTGMQMKGNNTNTAPPAGFIGEQITASASSIALTSAASKTITNITLTAGIWDISGICAVLATGGTAIAVALLVGIGTTTNVITGTLGQDFFQLNVTGAVISGVVPVIRATLSASTTYYLVAQATYTSTTCPGNGRITATRVG